MPRGRPFRIPEVLVREPENVSVAVPLSATFKHCQNNVCLLYTSCFSVPDRRRFVFKAFVIGVLVGVLFSVGGIYYYFVSGMAPAAAADPPMPFEKKMANRSLD